MITGLLPQYPGLTPFWVVDSESAEKELWDSFVPAFPSVLVGRAGSSLPIEDLGKRIVVSPTLFHTLPTSLLHPTPTEVSVITILASFN